MSECVALAHCTAEMSFVLHDAVELSPVLMRNYEAIDSVKSRVPRGVPLAVADSPDDLEHALRSAKSAFIDIRQRDLRHA